MTQLNPDSKFTSQSAQKLILANGCKIDGRVITVPARGMGLQALAALDFMTSKLGAVVKYEHVSVSNFIPVDLRGKIITSSVAKVQQKSKNPYKQKTAVA